MKTVGIVPISAKPAHKGHFALIKRASEECDRVYLFVSTSDRKRPGEVPILGKDMLDVWKNALEPLLPSNVVPVYGGSPVRKAYELLGKAEEQGTKDVFRVYSDPTDLTQNFPAASLAKYLPTLFKKKQVTLVPVDRADTAGISGTKMREMLASGDRAGFAKNLPVGADVDYIWKKLSANADVIETAGSSLMEYVQETLRELSQRRCGL